jgi:NAD(P)-dependent dehydrogenase (short-subunit alcohol dehydrogenase family)
MGSAMGGRVLGGGHDLLLYDPDPGQCADLVEKGAKGAGSIAEAAKGREVVISMLPSDAVLQNVVLGEGGLRDSLEGGAIHLSMGTHGVDMTREMSAAHSEAGQGFVAAPVLGRPELAAEGQLGIVPGGPAEMVERCAPLFEVIGQRTFAAGEKPESAVSIKIANNLVLGCAIEAMGEGFSLVRKFGVDPAVFYDVLTEGLFASVAYKVYGDIIAREAYEEVGVTATIGLKDANLAMAAAQGIGATYAKALAAEGAAVTVADIDDGSPVVAGIEADLGGARALNLITDVTDEASVKAMVARTEDVFGGLDIMVSNAAISGKAYHGPFEDMPIDQWDRLMAVNVKGPFLCARAAAPALRKRGGGKIINIASGTLFKGAPGLLHYVTSKGGVLAMTRSLSRELGDENIQVNTLAPGLTLSESILSGEHYDQAARDASVAGRALKREEQPEDLVGALLFLASADSDFMTGQCMLVDGGSAMN